MTTKKEIERLARKAFGPDAVYDWNDAIAENGVVGGNACVSVGAETKKERREMLAAALRGILQWKGVSEYSVTAAEVRALRDKTGASLLACRAALLAVHGDTERAERLCDEQTNFR